MSSSVESGSLLQLLHYLDNGKIRNDFVLSIWANPCGKSTDNPKD